MPSRYDVLVAFLAAQPADRPAVTLAFGQAAALLGAPLPAAARSPVWWRGRPRMEQRPGWRTVVPQLTPAGWVVTVRRVPPDTTS